MNRTILIVSAIVLAIALVLFVSRGDDESEVGQTPTPTASVTPADTATPAPTATVTPQSHTVRLLASGISPASITIRSGDNVTFVNETNTAWWPASDPHPVHTLCPGFDAQRSLQQNETYTLTFTEARTCTYHNHVAPANSSYSGSITVQ